MVKSVRRIAALGVVCLLMSAATASAQTKTDRCNAYARNAMANTPTTTGPVRGTVRGSIVGAIGGNAGAGAAVGALVGGTRHAVQKNRSYQYYYDSCMSRP